MTKSKDFRLCGGCQRRTTLLINMVAEHVEHHKHLYIPIHKQLPQFLQDHKKRLRIKFENELSPENKVFTKRIISSDTPTMKKKGYQRKWSNTAYDLRKEFKQDVKAYQNFVANLAQLKQ